MHSLHNLKYPIYVIRDHFLDTTEESKYLNDYNLREFAILAAKKSRLYRGSVEFPYTNIKVSSTVMLKNTKYRSIVVGCYGHRVSGCLFDSSVDLPNYFSNATNSKLRLDG